ncbi:anti-sigma factor [Gryllotalpicola reticulitermitis]|uniref:Anti-sigma factor n=1 Tax=Gryllotalpicola reticulitermitis TaxID=1184153 RepID=A0ABV8QC54_9MICO
MTPHEADDRHRRDDAARDELADALGALDDDEALAFTDAAAELAMQLPPVAPEAKTRAALLAQIGARAAQEPVGGAPVANLETHRRSRRRLGRAGLVLAAVAAALVLFFGGFASRTLVGGGHSEDAAGGDSIAKILAQPDAQRASQPISTGGTATLVWSAKQGRAAIILNNARPVPSGKTYELWFIRAGTPVAAGTLNASAAALSTGELRGAIEHDDQVAMTLEPSAGVSQPTTTPIVVIPTSAAP